MIIPPKKIGDRYIESLIEAAIDYGRLVERSHHQDITQYDLDGQEYEYKQRECFLRDFIENGDWK